MLFVSVKKYKETVWWLNFFEHLNKDNTEIIAHQFRLRELDKECIQALLDLLTRQGITPGVFEKSLVDQTLNQ